MKARIHMVRFEPPKRGPGTFLWHKSWLTWMDMIWFCNLNRWKLIRGGFKHLRFTFFMALFVLETSPISLTWQSSFCCPRRVENPIGRKNARGHFQRFPKIDWNPWVHLHLISDVLMNVQCLHQLELALHYVWAPWSPWSLNSPLPCWEVKDGWGQMTNLPPYVCSITGIYWGFLNLKILRQETQAWRNCIFQMHPTFHARHTSNRSPQKQYGSYTILTVAFCWATKALSKSPTPWWLIGSANPLKISNIFDIDETITWCIRYINSKIAATNATVPYIL